MLTRMTDQDWNRVVQVFRAVRSRRGDKGRNDRRFLEAVHYFCVHNITWRALPAEFGNWNSVWTSAERSVDQGDLRSIDCFLWFASCTLLYLLRLGSRTNLLTAESA